MLWPFLAFLLTLTASEEGLDKEPIRLESGEDWDWEPLQYDLSLTLSNASFATCRLFLLLRFSGNASRNVSALRLHAAEGFIGIREAWLRLATASSVAAHRLRPPLSSGPS